MRKKVFGQFRILLVLLLVISCQEEEPVLENLVAPTNVEVNAAVSTDQSGNVTVTPTAENAINFHVIFNPGDDPITIANGDSATFRYSQSGQYSTPITVVAFGAGGISSSATVSIDLDVSLRISPEILAQITGGDGFSASTKRWVWDRTVGGHFGVGPLSNNFPEFFSAGPNQINPCMYDDVLEFSHDGNDNYTFSLETGEGNETFINWTEVNRFFPEATPQQFADECRDISNQATFENNFIIIENTDGTQSLNVGNSFLSYWVVVSGEYEIVELSENRISVRGISQPFNGDDPLAWYFSFIPESDGIGGGGSTLETEFTNLIWSDEFDISGAPNPVNWTYDLGAGGWGNGESQSYTSNPENVIVEDDVLKITAMATGGGNGADVYYFDDIQIGDDSGNATETIQDFEGDSPSITGFEGASTAVIENPDATGINTSSTVVEFTKNPGAAFFAGAFFDFSAPLDLSVNANLLIKTWSPKSGAVVRIKLEDATDSTKFVEVDANTTVTNAWETLSYDLSGAPAFNYDRVVIFFDFGEDGPVGSGYTSARIKSQGLQEFTYGRVEARAKLPTGGGTWPAIWMLGANFPEVGWPAAGEMDIMEHVGNQQDIVFGSTHDPNNFGGTARTGSTLVAGVSEEYHIYEMEWTSTEIQFAVDGQVYHTVTNDGTLPFNNDFFFIMNVAMGGSFGGDIDAAFTDSTMEVDYIRMYQ
ncbi:glycoside hydrolase family 16 protein [Croceitalea vernalis]|uniref:Glycoside hydrolase family 16 protein n=1 Tax=Croceitalea vernalis TaxID=3075599 RepID=A0ABU3BJ90_9FLAO|nr:glycoside hydrolase family 16 protein [Croceitalea sp. P007]MDT0622237.1 glycoside hydrolase family 16 protein [Croceitalea sp. P007]